MAWYDRLLGRKSVSDPLGVFREIFGGRESKSGQTVNIRTALETSVVVATGRVIAEGLAQVPFKLLQRDDTGARREAREHPLYYLLSRQPNEIQTSFEFREQIGFHLALAGNAFVFKNVVNGRVLELLPFDPGWVTVKRDGWDVSYKVTPPDAPSYDVPAENMWHIRGPSWAGYIGLDMVQQARNAIGLALATEEFGSKLFANGARPGGIIVSKTALKPDAARDLAVAWKEAHGGSGNAMSTALLSGDLDYKPLSWSADEAQFMETRKAVIHEVCRFMRVLPIMVMQSEDTTSYSSVEQMFLAHLTHTLMPWYERVEQSAIANLLTEKEQADGYYIKFMANGLMRGTAKERAEYYQIALQNGWMARNEVRDAEDMDRFGDTEFDKPQQAANLYGPRGGGEAE